MSAGYTSPRVSLIFAIVLVIHIVLAAGLYATYRVTKPREAAPKADAGEVREQSTTEQTTPAGVRPPPPPQVQSYTVKPGDTYWEIAQRHGVTVKALKAYNGHAESRMLRAHETLQIPPRD